MKSARAEGVGDQQAPDLQAELASLRRDLAEAREILAAIRSGSVDAVMVSGDDGTELVYTLSGADTPYRHVIESLIEGAVTMTPDGTVLFCNGSVARILGRAPEEVIGTQLAEHVNPADRRTITGMITSAAEEAVRGEVTLMTSAGERRPVHLSISRMHVIGSPVLFCLVAAGLTDARRHQQVVAAERLARAILEQSAEMIVVCDEDQRIIRLSHAAERLCSGSPLKRRFEEEFPVRSRDANGFDLERVLRGETIRYLDVSVETPAGPFDCLLSASPLHTDDLARGCVINLVDVTDLRRSDAELRLRVAALDAAANAMVITDSQARIVWVNSAFSTLTGYAAGEAVGHGVGQLQNSGQQTPQFYRDMWEQILAGKVWHGELLNRRKDGSTYPEELTITPVHDGPGGQITHFIALKRDLTADRQLQSNLLQAQRLETVGRLAGGVAHDFNNVLTVISGIVDLALLELPPASALHADMREVQHSIMRANALTRQLLAFSRQQVLQPTLVDPNALVHDLMKMLQRLLAEDILLVTRLADDVGLVLADPGQLEQVVVNLCVNARDAMPDGGTMTVETRRIVADGKLSVHHGELAAGPFVVITLSDTGVGMSPAVLDKIFEPFFSTKPPGKGTGLGLATLHGIVTQSGGGLRVTSRPGAGSSFSVYLPEAKGKVDPIPRPASAVARQGTEVVLVVDDEAPLRAVTSRILGRAGYTVISAANGAEALEALARDDPVDLLLTDVVMPGMPGAELVARVRERYPHIRVLFMSGYTGDTILRHGVNSEHMHFVDKPFTMEKLAAKVRECLDEPMDAAADEPHHARGGVA